MWRSYPEREDAADRGKQDEEPAERRGRGRQRPRQANKRGEGRKARQ